MRASKDLYLDAGGKLVDESDPNVAELLAARGNVVPEKRLDRTPGLREAIGDAEEADKAARRQARAEPAGAEERGVETATPPPVSEGDRPSRRR